MSARQHVVRRRALRLLGTSCLLVAVALTVLPGGSAALEPSVVGWWHRDVPLSGEAEPAGAGVQAQGAGRPVVAGVSGTQEGRAQAPPPPELPPTPLPTTPPEVTVPDPGADVPTPSQAPDGGLLVAGDATGPRAMSALRFEAPDAGSALLRLTVAAGSTPSPGIQACPALSEWLPGADQPWAHRPAHDCERVSISSTLSPEGTTMEWSLPDTFKPPDSPHYDVVLLPVSGDGTPFQVAFDAPGPDAFTVTSPAPTVTPTTLDPLPDDLPPPIESFSPDGFAVGDLGGPSFSDGANETVTTRPTDRSTADGGPLGDLASALENPTQRRIAAMALVLLGAYAYRESGRSGTRMPQLLGALRASSASGSGVLLASEPRGIGRFSRPRSRPPSPL